MSNFHGRQKLVRNYVPVVFNPNGLCINDGNSFEKHFSSYHHHHITQNLFAFNNDTSSPVRDLTKQYSLTNSRLGQQHYQRQTPRVLVFERPSRWLKSSSRSPRNLTNQYVYDRCHFFEEEQKKTSVITNKLLSNRNHDNQQLLNIDGVISFRENTIALKKESEKCCKNSQTEADLRLVKSRKSLWLTSYYGIAPLWKVTYADLLEVLDSSVFH